MKKNKNRSLKYQAVIPIVFLYNFAFHIYQKMKKYSLILILLSAVLFFNRCDNDVDINASYQDIVVVYGLLDPNEGGTYLKVNKAFLGPENALIMAKIADSSQFLQKLQVKILDDNDPPNVYTFDTITVNNKEDGIFYNPNQQLYYHPFNPAPATKYSLSIFYNDMEITSETMTIENFTEGDITKPGFAKAIGFQPDLINPVRWYRQELAPRYDVTIRFHFKELWEGQTDTVYRYFDWFKDTQKTTIGEEVETYYNGSSFFSALELFVAYDDPAKEEQVTERYFGNVDFIVEAGGVELNTYMEVTEPSSSIIQDRPQYSNIENGVGIFSSRTRAVKVKKLNDETKFAIKEDYYTLKFQF